MIEIEIGDVARQALGIGEPGGGILGGVARDRERLGDGGVDGLGREIGGARVAAPLSDVHGDADALVAVVRDRLDFAAAHRDALPDGLRHLGLGRRCAAARAAASTDSATRSISAVGSGKRPPSGIDSSTCARVA